MERNGGRTVRHVRVRKLDNAGGWEVITGAYHLASFVLEGPMDAVRIVDVVPGTWLEDIIVATCAARRALRSTDAGLIGIGVELDAGYVGYDGRLMQGDSDGQE